MTDNKLVYGFKVTVTREETVFVAADTEEEASGDVLNSNNWIDKLGSRNDEDILDIEVSESLGVS